MTACGIPTSQPRVHTSKACGHQAAHAADEHPEALLADGRFLGSGSSQAAAVVAGVAALLRQAHPSATPDDIKHMLVRGAAPLQSKAIAVGAGLVDAVAALTVSTRHSKQLFAPAVGSVSQPVMGVIAIGSPTEWSGVSWSGVSPGPVCPGLVCQLVGCVLVRCVLVWCQLVGRVLVRCQCVVRCVLVWVSAGPACRWSGVSWSGVSWSGVSWSGVSWSGCVAGRACRWSGVSWS